MKFKIYGRKSCPKCQSIRRKVSHLLKRIGVQAAVVYIDMDTVDGMAEAMWDDAYNPPTTIFELNGAEIARWGGRIPKSDEMMKAMGE